ncbi:YhgE/Pip domain-containing protein [Pseudobutyrivibrio ruminis]|uniref:Putative membrane protein n=1 Tax=Pseudobutyrivibrio ruminis DSM 9787 TaxID=1123011 RepID=A0A285SRA7_9FIRM|nr:YhgE/Pip domain-containing protein [Pseudobutyrivibrio ruminis]SOC10758.1 putative membrane protein [Pseudobutyrivibrio ruminis DSM 9787]
MKTIKKIFFDDIISLVKNFFALVIVVGICFLPALYAWFNIYSNWDPYGNTGALKFAAVSLDKGYTDEEGEYHNQGDTIIENLHENTSVDWQFVDSEEDAVNGVYSGEYYAAIVVDEDFTYNMYNVLTDDVKRPVLHFYENQKKNPVATKISDTVAQSLQNNINVAFTEVVVSRVFSSASDVSEDMQEKGGVDEIVNKLESLSADLTTYQNAMTTIIENDAQLKASLEAAEQDATNVKNQAEQSAKSLETAGNITDKSDTTINSYSQTVERAMTQIEVKSASMNEKLDTATLSEDATMVAKSFKDAMIDALDMAEIAIHLPDHLKDTEISEAKKQFDNATAEILSVYKDIPEELIPQDLRDKLAKLQSVSTAINALNPSSEDYAKQVEEADEAIKEAKEALNNVNEEQLVEVGADNLKAAAANARKKGEELNKTLSGPLREKVDEGLSSLEGMLYDSSAILNTVGETFGNLVVMFDAIGNTVDCADTSLQKTSEAIVYVNGRIIEAIAEIEEAGADEKIQVLVNALSGDPETYGKFFSTPVEMKTEAVYPIENYGSAVAPFYSTLAFWVGALILTAIIKIKPDKDKYPGASERQLYFGRYVLYWVLGQIQAVIIVLGDIFLLHVQCLHPWLFLLAGSVIATTFTILIYSLVTTWGDAGKALAVVLVVIQIAGSSGTYPIELLPEFFRKVYIFFPFPYAINSIRECLCGTYECDYLKYLGTLVIFMGVSLVIGLLVRIPFEKLNHYMEERMEDTEMM